MDLSHWLDLVAAAARQLAATVLDLPHAAFVRLPGTPSGERLRGIYLPLANEHEALQLGVLAEPADCTQLARWFLRLSPGERFDDEDVVIDTLAEFTRLLAVELDKRRPGQLPLHPGVPLAVRGWAVPLGRVESVEGVLEVEDSLFWLVVMGTRHAAPP